MVRYIRDVSLDDLSDNCVIEFNKGLLSFDFERNYLRELKPTEALAYAWCGDNFSFVKIIDSFNELHQIKMQIIRSEFKHNKSFSYWFSKVSLNFVKEYKIKNLKVQEDRNKSEQERKAELEKLDEYRRVRESKRRTCSICSGSGKTSEFIGDETMNSMRTSTCYKCEGTGYIER